MEMNVTTLSKKIFQIFLVVIILAVICFFAIYLPFVRVTTERKDFEGVVINKWVNILETEQGSRPTRFISVKSDVGEQFNIIVDGHTYNRLQTGTRIKRTSTNGIQVDESANNP